jgi:hypothetical protein
MARKNRANPTLQNVPLNLVTHLDLISTQRDEWLPRTLPLFMSCTHLTLHSLSDNPTWHLVDRLAHFSLLPPNVKVLELKPGRLRTPVPLIVREKEELHRLLPRLRRLELSPRYEGVSEQEDVWFNRLTGE